MPNFNFYLSYSAGIYKLTFHYQKKETEVLSYILVFENGKQLGITDTISIPADTLNGYSAFENFRMNVYSAIQYADGKKIIRDLITDIYKNENHIADDYFDDKNPVVMKVETYDNDPELFRFIDDLVAARAQPEQPERIPDEYMTTVSNESVEALENAIRGFADVDYEGELKRVIKELDEALKSDLYFDRTLFGIESIDEMINGIGDLFDDVDDDDDDFFNDDEDDDDDELIFEIKGDDLLFADVEDDDEYDDNGIMKLECFISNVFDECEGQFTEEAFVLTVNKMFNENFKSIKSLADYLSPLYTLDEINAGINKYTQS